MELKDFISNTLTQIAEGVKDAQPKFKELGGAVNPEGFQQVSGDIPFVKQAALRDLAKMLCNVQFAVSLTSDNSSNSTGGVGVLFGAITVGGKSGNETKEQSLTSVKFNVPILLPAQKP